MLNPRSSLSRRRLLGTAVAGVGAIVTASLEVGCTGSSAPAPPAQADLTPPASDPAQAPARESSRWSGPPRKLAYGGPGGTTPTQPSCTDFTTFLPLEKGWYAELGVDFEKVNLPASAYYPAIDARQLDAVQDDTNLAGVRAQGIGEDLVSVWNHTNSGTFHGVARPGLNVWDPSAWVGAKVRVDRPGGIVNIYQAKFIASL